MLLLDHRYLPFGFATRRVMVSDETRSRFGINFVDNLNDPAAIRTQSDPLDSSILKMFRLEIPDRFQRWLPEV